MVASIVWQRIEVEYLITATKDGESNCILKQVGLPGFPFEFFESLYEKSMC